MKSFKPPIQILSKAGHVIGFIFIWLSIVIARHLPQSWRNSLSTLAGWLAIRLLPMVRTRALRNLKLIYPHASHQQHLKIGGQVVANFFLSLGELLNNDKLAEACQTGQIELGDKRGLDDLRRAARQKKGALIVSGHFGQWEAIRHFLAADGMETGSIYRPNSNPYYEKLFLRNIKLGGEPILQTGSKGVIGLVRHVKNGGFMAILTDQRQWRAPFLDFLGRPAKTSIVAAELALKYQVPLVCAYATRQDNGKIRLDFEPQISSSSPEKMMQSVNDSLGARVRATPGQWFWLHQRWGK